MNSGWEGCIGPALLILLIVFGCWYCVSHPAPESYYTITVRDARGAVAKRYENVSHYKQAVGSVKVTILSGGAPPKVKEYIVTLSPDETVEIEKYWRDSKKRR